MDVNVADTIVTEAVTSVLPMLIVQADVFSEADSVTSVITEVDDVAPTKTAVAVSNGTSIKYHAAPSLAIAQSVAELGAGSGKNRFTADTVFGVAV